MSRLLLLIFFVSTSMNVQNVNAADEDGVLSVWGYSKERGYRCVTRSKVCYINFKGGMSLNCKCTAKDATVSENELKRFYTQKLHQWYESANGDRKAVLSECLNRIGIPLPPVKPSVNSGAFPGTVTYHGSFSDMCQNGAGVCNLPKVRKAGGLCECTDISDKKYYEKSREGLNVLHEWSRHAKEPEAAAITRCLNMNANLTADGPKAEDRAPEAVN